MDRRGHEFDRTGFKFTIGFFAVVVTLLVLADYVVGQISAHMLQPTIYQADLADNATSTTADLVATASPSIAPLAVAHTTTKQNDGRVDLLPVPLPALSSTSYLVADLETGQVFLEKNSHQSRPIASISKLMTALVASETIGYNDLIPISAKAVDTEGDSGDLHAGEKMYLNLLFYPLLLDSSNDAATAIAEYGGGNDFIDKMNQKADELGMKDTHFSDPSGLSPNNRSSVSDLALLARYMNASKRFLFDITTQMERKELRADGSVRVFHNIHPFVTDSRFRGGKPGFTPEAGQTLLSLFSLPMEGRNHLAIIVVLDSNDETADSHALLNWLVAATK
jgi:D-alanyl-D-alanine carboxypeptidase